MRHGLMMACVAACLIMILAAAAGGSGPLAATAQMEQVAEALARNTALPAPTATALARLIEQPWLDCSRVACEAELAARNRIARARLKALVAERAADDALASIELGAAWPDAQWMTPSSPATHPAVTHSGGDTHMFMAGGARSGFAAALSGLGDTGRAATVDSSSDFSFGYLEFEATPEQRAQFGTVESGPVSVSGSLPSRALMTEIATWLTANFELPATDDFPRVEFASPTKLTALRFGAFSGRRESASEPAAPHPPLNVGSDLLAVYDTSARIIYLPEGWSGKSHAETSILVHEMVHHLQTVGGLKYVCAAAREMPAYLAQDLWLRRFGQDLETTIETDLFTALVRSLCFY
jgi:hypothetical protein